MTWQQFAGWRQYDREEPFGEPRADARAAANTIWSKGMEVGGETPDLIWPYFGDGGQDLLTRAKALDAKVEELKRGREQHRQT